MIKCYIEGKIIIVSFCVVNLGKRVFCKILEIMLRN